MSNIIYDKIFLLRKLLQVPRVGQYNGTKVETVMTKQMNLAVVQA